MRIDFGDSSNMSGGQAWSFAREESPAGAFAFEPSSDIDLVRRHGGPVSHAALNPAFRTFRFPGIDGLIAFQLHRRCAVVMGDPICPPEQRTELAAAFAKYCAHNKWSVFYAVASDEMQRFNGQAGGGALEVGDLLIADPQHDPEAGSKARSLRRNINRVRRENVKVWEYHGNSSPDPELEARAELALESWRANRTGFQMYVALRIFADRPGCRWFIAEREGAIVGLLYMTTVNCGGCRYSIDLVFATPDAPRHTSELLVVTAFKALREEGEKAVCLGVGPKAELGEIHGFGPIASRVARGVYQLSNRMMPQHGKTVFWEKFGIVRREPVYLLFERPRVGVRELGGLLKAYNFTLQGVFLSSLAAICAKVLGRGEELAAQARPSQDASCEQAQPA